MKNSKEPKVKLTLSVKKSAIDQAKRYAIQEGSSLSNIVEDYLVQYTKTNKPEEQEFRNSIAFQLMGCAKDGPLSNMSDDEIKAQMIKDRHGL